MVVCPHKEKCSDVNKLCSSCKHNENRSYYEPAAPLPYPYYPYPYYPTWTPYYPWFTTTTNS